MSARTCSPSEVRNLRPALARAVAPLEQDPSLRVTALIRAANSSPITACQALRMREQPRRPAVDIFRAQLPSAPKRAEFVVASAVAAEIDEEELLSACDELNVRTKWGVWRLPA